MGVCLSNHKKVVNEKAVMSNKEQNFESLRSSQVIHQKKDLQVSKSDFIFQHKGSIFTDFYKLDEQLLGEGGYGKVQRCILKSTKEIRAVKIMSKNKMSSKEKTRLKYEIDLLKNLDHPNIVKLYEVFEDKQNIYLVTELCNGGELFDMIVERQQLQEEDSANVMRQLLSAVAYCHSRKVAHRDLKPENILFDKENKDAIRVIDFGTSQVFEEGDQDKMQQAFGTSYYIAPEVLKGGYNEKCDIWSAGVILFIMLSGRPPFNGRTDQDILKKVKEGKYYFNDPIWKKRSQESMDLINKMLTYDSVKRISAMEALNHPWFSLKVQVNMDLQATSQALNNLKSFRSEQKLQQAALTFIVCNLSSKQEQEELYNTFRGIDTNGDGKISKTELFNAYHKMYQGQMDDEQITQAAEKLFQQADQDGSGEIDYTEWQIGTISKRNVLQEEKLLGAFKLFDRDGSGSISAQEVKEILSVGKQFSNDAIWAEIIKEVDVNGDGEISYEEFKLMMQKFLSGEFIGK